MNKRSVVLLAMFAVGSCAKPQTEQPSPRTEPSAKSPRVVEGRRQVARTTVDPTSSEAAVELVRGFASLLNSNRVNDAYMLLGVGSDSRSEFKAKLARFDDVHVEVGAADGQEGAAGSTFVTVPITLSDRSKPNPPRRKANVILRRVNDVPGSTEAQRHWHIENIDWAS